MSTSFYTVLGFYILLIVICAVIGHFVKENDGVIIGMLLGAILSTILWYSVGKEMVQKVDT
jgi:divalent metal cation (Fe/Co/Zn/Cd) transporter